MVASSMSPEDASHIPYLGKAKVLAFLGISATLEIELESFAS